MADNYIEKQQEAYEARKAAWKLAIKKGKKATTHQAKVKQTTETVTDTVTLKRRVFITGGAEGIGKSIVSMFCQKGDSVHFVIIMNWQVKLPLKRQELLSTM